jgi:ATP-dependent protease ClpP protease subunit
MEEEGIYQDQATVEGDTLIINTLERVEGWGWTTRSLSNELKGFKGSKILVPINSYGGDILDGLGYYNLLLGHPAQVTTQVVGFAMSMGSIILQAGDVRRMPENSWLMIHNPLMSEWGDYRDMEAAKQFLIQMTLQMAQIYHKRNSAGLSIDEIQNIMDNETWIEAERALELGFVDELTEGVSLQASLDPSFLKINGTPKNLILSGSSEEEGGNPKMKMKMNFEELGKGLAQWLEKNLGPEKGPEGEVKPQEDSKPEGEPQGEKNPEPSADGAGSDFQVDEALLNDLKALQEANTQMKAELKLLMDVEKARKTDLQKIEKGLAEMEVLKEELQKTQSELAKANGLLAEGKLKADTSNGAVPEVSASVEEFQDKVDQGFKQPANKAEIG